MNCRTFGQLLVIFTFIHSSLFALNVRLPEKLSVAVGKSTVHGFRANLDYIRFVITTKAENLAAAQSMVLTKEGFAYQIQPGEEFKIAVIAWSESGRRNDILIAAKKALEQQIESNAPAGEKPGGYRHFSKVREEFGHRNASNTEPSKRIGDHSNPASKAFEAPPLLVQAHIGAAPTPKAPAIANPPIKIDWARLALAAIALTCLILALRGTVLLLLR